MAAASIYQAMYGQENPNEPGQTSIPATFQIVYFIGEWAWYDLIFFQNFPWNDFHRYFHRRDIAIDGLWWASSVTSSTVTIDILIRFSTDPRLILRLETGQKSGETSRERIR